MDKNLRCSSKYRRYNDFVPDYLQERPRAFVKHCIEKIGLANELNATNIKKVGYKTYEISNGTNGSKYQLYFGDESTPPSCQCYTWKRLKLPCKHFFAVIRNGLEIWQSFPEMFRNSPYTTLDDAVLPASSDAPSKCIAHLEDNDTEQIKPDDYEEQKRCPPVVFQLPMRKLAPRTKLNSCRELLKEILSLTYNIYQEEVCFKIVVLQLYFLLFITEYLLLGY